jgi:hypothetical protein
LQQNFLIKNKAANTSKEKAEEIKAKTEFADKKVT